MSDQRQQEADPTAASASGPLGPALAGAISDYNEALARHAAAEQALEAAQRELAGARARLSGLAAGARITGAKALVVVRDADATDAARPGAS
jgi:hypothetical protein